MSFDFSKIVPFLIAILVLFVVYRRFRRSFGQQPLRPVRMQVRIVVLLVVGCLLLTAAFRSAAFISAVLAGIVAGVALAMWGAARTRFLRVSGQLYYVPHTYTGIAVSFLFLGRLVYRLIQVTGNVHAIHAAAPDSASQGFAPAGLLQSPLTLGLYFVLMGYYVCYYSMVLRKSKRVVAEEVSLSAPLPGEPLRGESEKRA
jgi:NhaP-type Na+/H+ or K+/H+ antiporter